MPPSPTREIAIGDGIIDIAVHPKGYVAIADVSGLVVVLDRDLREKFTKMFDMPVWGIDLSEDGDVLAVALADKSLRQGRLCVYDWRGDNEIAKVSIDAPAWDCKFSNSTVYCTTWGRGVIGYNMISGATTTFALPGDLYGLSLDSGRPEHLLVTVSGVGVVRLAPSDDSFEVAQILPARHACYKNIVAASGKVVSGSNNGMVFICDSPPAVDGAANAMVRSYRLPLRDISTVLNYSGHLILASLSGALAITPEDNPALILNTAYLSAQIWHLTPSWEAGKILVARGDGILGEYLVEELLRPEGEDSIMFSPGSLAGIKVFLSYASEDRDQVAEVYRHLRMLGASPWMDRFDILPGQNWKLEIARALRRSDFVLIFFSSGTTKKRGYIQKEIREALNLLAQLPEDEVLVIPVRLDDCEPPESLSDRQWVSLYEPDGMKRLLLSMESHRRPR